MHCNKNQSFILFSLACLLCWSNGQAQDYFKVKKGKIDFTSDAPLELIKASSENLRGLINPKDNTFAFAVKMDTFRGFNSPLQREHFNENYMESLDYPEATFSGKIIESVDLSKPGRYTVRAKGKLKIHGVEQERIIKSEVWVTDNSLELSSRFSVLLEEHDISIPKIVYQKIAEEIAVEIQATLSK